MPEQAVAFAEPPERPKNQQGTDSAEQPEFVVGMSVASASETTTATQPDESKIQERAELPQFVVEQEAAQQAHEANFAQHQQEFAALDSETLQYVLEKFTTDKLSEVTALEAAGLLLAVNENQNIAISEEQVDALATILEEDAATADLYWQEVYGAATPQELAESVQELAESDLQTEVSGSELSAATEALNRQDAAFQQLREDSPILAEAVQMLEEENARREGVLAAATEQIVEIENEIDPISQEIEEGAQINEVTNNGDHLEVTVTNKDGTQKKTKVTEGNLFGYMLVAALTDSIFGGNNLERAMNIWLKHNVAAPLLEKIGLDPQVLFEQFGSDKYKAMDGWLKTMNDQSCKEHFERVMTDDYLYETLEILDPEHLKKIFNPTGTQKFGQSGFLGYDHLQLPQELVDKMYDKLTPRQREVLRIPVKTAVQPQTQTTAS